ncbi:MAG: hypothetical protein JW839_10210 [Candidatus Lokiarchaeota archaeon]|nr:hypothetical protein [Candidatus Lokiarchaeota archaeon]
MSETSYKPKDREEIKDKRSYFVGDRVALSQVLLLCLTGLSTCWIQGSPPDLQSKWMTALAILSVLMAIAVPMTLSIWGVEFSFELHWLWSALACAAFWLPLTTWIGLLIDGSLHGTGNCLLVSTFVAVDYAIGYALARAFRAARNRMPGGAAKAIGAATLVTVAAGCIVAGIVIPTIHLIVAGIGIALSALFAYYMLHALFDEQGVDVVEDTPNRLIIICLRNSIIMTAIFWFFVELLLPFVPAAGGGGKKKSRSSGRSRGSSRRQTRYRSSYRRRGSYPDAFVSGAVNPERVEMEWARYGLGLK